MTAHNTPKSILLQPTYERQSLVRKAVPGKKPVLNHHRTKQVRGALAARTLPLHRHDAHQQQQPRLLLCNMRNYYATRRPSMLPPRTAPVPSLLVSEDDDATDDDSVVSSESSVEERPSKVRVRFSKRNDYFTIPNRRDYTDEDKKALFHGKKELRKMVAKNHTEHAFEGRNWRDAPEEEDFWTDPTNGQILHPVHAELQGEPQRVPRKRLASSRRRVDRQRKRRRVTLPVQKAETATTDAAVKRETTEEEEVGF